MNILSQFEEEFLNRTANADDESTPLSGGKGTGDVEEPLIPPQKADDEVAASPPPPPPTPVESQGEVDID